VIQTRQAAPVFDVQLCVVYPRYEVDGIAVAHEGIVADVDLDTPTDAIQLIHHCIREIFEVVVRKVYELELGIG
jgi:hypothetical protein